jgi:uncharacterized membrane protein
MDKRIGIVIILIALVVGAIAVVEKINTEKLITEFRNQTGTCYIDGTCLHEQTNTTFIILGIAAGVLFVIGAIIVILSVYEKPQKDRKIEKPKKLLTPEQKKLYNILLESDGSMLQGELVAKSGLNKVTVSRVLDKLEMQGVVERRRHGMSNIVVLKKE